MSKDLFSFFWSSPNFGHKTVPITSENRFSLVLHLRNSPTIANSWLRACMPLQNTASEVQKRDIFVMVHFDRQANGRRTGAPPASGYANELSHRL